MLVHLSESRAEIGGLGDGTALAQVISDGGYAAASPTATATASTPAITGV
jgi:hypothetical protein